ncbi:MAG TPA: hypothetical protein VJW77_09695 [Terriglobia bacterium]|nr:hypothetical protein [Terriglobia bacterium]
MRCDAVRQIVEEGMARTPAVQVHIESCSDCKEYLSKWEMLHAGLAAMREDEPPEPSVGFTSRLMRRLENAPSEFQFGQQLIDQIGRRVVYATLMVALMLGLILALPPSGPLRSSGISQSVFVQTQMATLANEQIMGVDGIETGDAPDSTSTGNGGTEATGSR